MLNQDLNALIDRSIITKAQQNRDAAITKVSVIQDQIATAQDTLAAAQAVPAQLAAQLASGVTVTAADRSAAQTKIAEAVVDVGFLQAALAVAQDNVSEADAALSAASVDATAPCVAEVMVRDEKAAAAVAVAQQALAAAQAARSAVADQIASLRAMGARL